VKERGEDREREVDMINERGKNREEGDRGRKE
jgi:hypothetical protein